jgi:tetratricopeptide (TPR) repeat protein
VGALQNNAKELEKRIAAEKALEKEKEKALIKQLYDEGTDLLEMRDYEAAIDNFAHILEIDPKHKGAKSGIRKVKKELSKLKRASTPEVLAKRLLKSGKAKYGRQDFDGAIEDLQDALALDYKNEDILEWLKRARRRQRLEEVESEERDLARETEVATERKEAQEKRAMLEVETAYLPPEKPERKPVEIEELISPEEEREERARKELLRKLAEKTVPAVSLTEADMRDVIRQLMEITGVTIVIDEGALAQSVGTEPLRITFSTVNPLPLLEVLDIALRATELGYRVEPNYIWISTPEKLEKQNLVTRTYRLKYGVRRVRKVELKEFETTKGGSN